jgi:hypothetical protein
MYSKHLKSMIFSHSTSSGLPQKGVNIAHGNSKKHKYMHLNKENRFFFFFLTHEIPFFEFKAGKYSHGQFLQLQILFLIHKFLHQLE